MTHSARNTDPVTSHLAAIESPGRVAQKNRILLSYYLRKSYALTDEAAAELAGVNPRSCWWHRCSDLREEGLIERATGEDNSLIKVQGSQGRPVHVCVITMKGIRFLRQNGLIR